MALTGGNLFSTNALIIASCSFDSNHPYNPQVSSVWRHFCRDIHRDYGCKILSPAEQTGGAVFSALAGGSLFSTNTESAVVTGNVRVSNGDFLQ